MANLQEILSAPVRSRGNVFEDFEVGATYAHHWGRTIDASDNLLFCTTTLQFNPLYFNAEHARAKGHPDLVVAPMLVFSIVFGLSVEDLSERGGAFLGIEELAFSKPVHVGDTLTARSTVAALRESAKEPNYGIATWHTEGFDQSGTRVVDFKRSNMVVKREHAA
jgi:itaconyl-CoA hydratase